MKTIIYSFIYHIICILLCMITFSCTSSAPEDSILVIQSYETTYEGYTGLNDKILHEFKKQNINPKIHTFYLDCESYLDKEELERMYNFLDTIQNSSPKIILVYDDQATYSLLACKHPFVKQIPVIFAGVNFPNWSLLEQYSNVTGFWDKPEYWKTANISNTLLDPMHIHFWSDKTFLGKQSSLAILEELYNNGVQKFGNHLIRKNKGGIYLEKWEGLPSDKKKFRGKPLETDYSGLNSRNTNSIDLLWSLSGLVRSSVFVQSIRNFTSKRLGAFTDGPTLTVFNEGFGMNENLLGGYITTLDTQTEISVKAATEILKGKDVRSIPITQSPKEYIIDWKEVKRWKIPLNRIPSDYQFINRPFYEQYKTILIIVGGLAGFILFGIFYYLIHLYLKENKNRKLAQESLKKGERFLSLALTGGKVFAFQLRNDIFYFDSDFYQTVGMEERVVTVDEFQHCIHPDDVRLFQKNVTDAREGHELNNISQIRWNLDTTEYQWWEFRYTYNKNENIFTGLCLNIQKVKQTEQELIDARQKAVESDKMKSAFLANMSHEIRTPLNAIVGFSNIISTEEVDISSEERKSFLGLINTNSELLLKLINDILDLSRIESGKMDFSFSHCNLTVLMTSIYQTHKLLMPNNVELKLEIPRKGIEINIDQHRLMQVITNLINNAAKFTQKGYIEIGYKYDKEKRGVLIYVKDTGIGIPEEKQEAVFERFNKLDEFAQGTGLGLAICQVIIKRFGRQIELQSEKGKGSCFTIALPLHIPL